MIILKNIGDRLIINQVLDTDLYSYCKNNVTVEQAGKIFIWHVRGVLYSWIIITNNIIDMIL